MARWRGTVLAALSRLGLPASLIQGDVHIHNVGGTPETAMDALAWELRKIRRGGIRR